jgi:WW domain
MEESVVLEEDIDPNYIPTDDEIRDYAESLGLVLPDDSDLLYLAREGIKARLPKEWKPCQTRGEEIYYFNFETGESVWEHPCDTFYKKKVQEAKAAKKLRVEKGKFKTPQPKNAKILNTIGFNPVLEQPDNPEFLKRKKELEEEFKKFSEQARKEYSEKVNFI